MFRYFHYIELTIELKYEQKSFVYILIKLYLLKINSFHLSSDIIYFSPVLYVSLMRIFHLYIHFWSYNNKRNFCLWLLKLQRIKKNKNKRNCNKIFHKFHIIKLQQAHITLLWELIVSCFVWWCYVCMCICTLYLYNNGKKCENKNSCAENIKEMNK